MDILLISARGAGAEPHWSRAVAADTAAALVAAGHRVRWLCAATATEPQPPAPAGVETTLVRGRRPAFRRVQRRFSDWRADVALARLLRPDPADVVLHIGFGAPGSVTTLWLADRMGARVLAVVNARELLCHRGTLIDAQGAECRKFDDAARCAACCAVPTGGGLTATQARLARLLRPLGGLSPFPSRVQFLNRYELALASLQLAAAVVVAEPWERDMLWSAGLPARCACSVEERLPGSRLAALVGGC
jgi:hypothetical protein